MFDAQKTEREIKQNLADFILDWKKIRDADIRIALRNLWTSATPKEGSLLSDLLIENNFPYLTSNPPATLNSIHSQFYTALIKHLLFRENVLQSNKLPALAGGKRPFEGNTNLQKSFFSLLQSNTFSCNTELFAHQEKALKVASEGKDFILSSGTGSGKTEAFLLPALARLFNETDAERRQSGIRVLIIYPMNALINSQIHRLQSLIGAQESNREPIRFALYNSKLKESLSRFNVYTTEQAEFSSWPDCQTLSREELRMNPPHILVTNYSMLEYALIRPKDYCLFYPERQKLHTIILDEAHTYIGAMAAEIAMLIRRVLLACNKTSADVQCFATSATLGDPQKDDGLLLRKFASQLFSKDISCIQYIDGSRVKPLTFINHKKPIPNSEIIHLLDTLEDLPIDASEQTRLKTLQQQMPSIVSDTYADALYQAISRNEDLVKIVNDLTKEPITLSKLTELYGIQTQQSFAYSILKALSLMRAKNTKKPLVKLRLHSVVEAPDGIFYCRSCKTFSTTFHEYCRNPSCKQEKMWELVVCKECGEAYLCCDISKEGRNPRIDWRSKTTTLALQLLRFDGTPDTLHHCFTCLHPSSASLIEDEEAADISQEFDSYVIDPEIALYKQVFFSAISVSVELIQKIAIDTLYANLEPHKEHDQKWLPGKGRRLLTFTDNRQGAAKLPTALDWLHEIYLGNRLMYESIKQAFIAKQSHSKEPFESFSDRGQMWLEDRPDAQKLLEDMVFHLTDTSKTNLTQELSNLISKHPSDFHFNKFYQEQSLLDDLIGSVASENTITFLDASEVLGSYSDFREMAGIFEKIEEEEPWNNPQYCRVLAYWVLIRSLGVLCKSQYLPENSGLFKLAFPLPPAFLDVLQENHHLSQYSKEQLGNLVEALINHMRAHGGIASNTPSYEEKLYSAYRYILQNALINKYFMLTRNEIPQNAPTNITGWYTLHSQKETTLSAMIRKALGDKDLGIEACQNLLAELWPYLIRNLSHYFKAHETVLGAYALNLDRAIISEDPVLYRCPVCKRTTAHHINGYCISSSCFGKVEMLDHSHVQDLYGYKRTITFPKLGMRTVEHTAQLELSELTENEKLFIDGKINILSSSTTMELGIDIGGINSIFLTNCPPGPSNYLQRAGRAGRRLDRLSYVLTSARKVPLDHYFFLHPDLFFTRKPHDPYVSLNSEKIVKRHVNSFILRSFFDQLTKCEPSLYRHLTNMSNPLSSYGTVATFFGFENNRLLTHPIIEHLLTYLQQAPNVVGISFLLKSSQLAIAFNKDSYFSDLYDFFNQEYEQLKAYVEGLDQEIDNQIHNQRRQEVLRFYRSALLTTDIVTFLINLSLLPKYGFPTDVVSLNTVNKRPKSGTTDDAHSQNRFRLQRSSEIAIREYAPGAEIIAGKRLIKSKGLAFSSYIGGESFCNDTNLESRGYVECINCHHFFVVPPLLNEMACPVCGKKTYRKAKITDNESLQEKTNRIRYGVVPKGFRVDYQDNQPYAPNKINKESLSTAFYASLQTDSEAFIQIVPDILQIATTQSATFYAINKGPGEMGYTICPVCGRSVASLHYTPELLKKHQRLYSEKRCPNESLLFHRSLIAEFITDAIQIRLSPKTLSLKQNEVFMHTFARCLQLSAAKFLGIDDRELRFLVQAYYDCSTNTWNNQEIVLFDNVPGGAGYSEMIVNLFWDRQFYTYLLESTQCPDDCADACPACLITYERDEAGKQTYNRHMVREFLEQEDIKAFFSTYIGTINPDVGDRVVHDVVHDIAALLMGNQSATVVLYFNNLPKDEFSIIDSKFGILLDLAKQGNDVTMVFPSSLILKSHTIIQKNLGYGLSYAKEHLQLRVRDVVDQSSLTAVVDLDQTRFVYENFFQQTKSYTPFDLLPYIRKSGTKEKEALQPLSPLKLDADRQGIQSLRTEYKSVEAVSKVALWGYLSEKFGLEAAKTIEEVWYADRYLLRYSENVCLLMILNDMPLIPEAKVHIVVHDERTSYSEFAFYNRVQQQTFFKAQATIHPKTRFDIQLYVAVETSSPTDPGQAHQRELQIKYTDGSYASFTFDAGMSFFSPYIDRNWNYERESYLSMMCRMEESYHKHAKFMDSLIFFYPEIDEDFSLSTRFRQARSAHRIKPV